MLPIFIMKFTDIEFSKLYKNPNGSSRVYLKVEGQDMLIPTTKLDNSFGASDYKGDKRFSLTLKVDDKLTKNLGKIDTKVVEMVREDKQLWTQLGLKKKPTTEQLLMIYKPLVKESEQYGNSINVKLQSVYGKEEFKTKFYNTDKEEMNINFNNVKEEITFRTSTKSIIHLQSVWFVGGKFGVTTMAKQVLVYPTEKLEGYAFLDSDTEEEEEDVVRV